MIIFVIIIKKGWLLLLYLVIFTKKFTNTLNKIHLVAIIRFFFDTILKRSEYVNCNKYNDNDMINFIGKIKKGISINHLRKKITLPFECPSKALQES